MLKALFEQLNMQVDKYDYNSQDLLRQVSEFARRNHSDKDIAIVVILAHGSFGKIHPSNKEAILVQDILNEVDKIKTRKWVLIQACRK